MATSKISQFIYGKFVNDKSCGYDIIASTDDLEENREQLKDLVKKSHHFWGGQAPSDGDDKAVGICWNNTGILKQKEILLFQVAPPVNEQNQTLNNGGRSFVQYRYMFVEKSLVSQFNNHLGIFFINFRKELIPFFSQSVSRDDSWTNIKVFELVNTIVCDLINDPAYLEKKTQFFSGQKVLLLQALSLILNKQRLLLTSQENTESPLLFLENLLCWLPKTYRNKLSIAVGSLDEKFCDWADLIIKLNSHSGKYSSSPQLTWLDRSKSQLSSSNNSNNTEHQYVKNFIREPLEQNWIEASAILSFLESVEDIDFDPTQPSLHFIFQYPVKKEYYQEQKTLFLREYWSNFKDTISNFIDALSSDTIPLDKYFSVIWQVLRDDDDINDVLALSFFNKVYELSRDYFLSIVKNDQKFEPYFPILLHNNFLKSIDFSTHNQDLSVAFEQQFIALLNQQKSFAEKYKILSLCLEHSNIFNTELKCFKLTVSILTESTTLDEFKKLFLEKIALYLPSLELSSIINSPLDTYLKNHQKDAIDQLYCLLKLKQKEGIKHLVCLTDILEMDNAEVQKLYLIFLQRWQLDYQQSLPILISIIEKSVDKTGGQLRFELSPFIEIYQNPLLKEKSNLIESLSALKLISESRLWLNWKKLAFTLDEKWATNIKVIVFLDEILADYFPREILKVWLNLFLTTSQNSDYEEYFLTSKTWKLLDNYHILELREDLISNYSSCISKLIFWAAIHKDRSILLDSLLDCIQVIWKNQELIDQSLWTRLTVDVLPKSSNNLYWLKLASIKISTCPNLVLPMPLQPLSSEQKQKLYQDLSNRFSEIDSPRDIDIMLKFCQDLSLDLVRILSYAKPTAYNLAIVSKYCSLSQQDDGYLLPFVKQLIQMPLKDDDEKRVLKELLWRYVPGAISNQELFEAIKDYLIVH
jgi:hypothetical protein